MVRSRFLTPEHLIRAINVGDFYASSGVTLTDLNFDAESQTLTIGIQGEAGVKYRTDFIGTKIDYDKTSQPRRGKDGEELASTRKYSTDVGQILHTVEGKLARYQLTGGELYVRALITADRPVDDPAFAGQFQQAWTQPVGWRKQLVDNPPSKN